MNTQVELKATNKEVKNIADVYKALLDGYAVRDNYNPGEYCRLINGKLCDSLGEVDSLSSKVEVGDYSIWEVVEIPWYITNPPTKENPVICWSSAAKDFLIFVIGVKDIEFDDETIPRLVTEYSEYDVNCPLVTPDEFEKLNGKYFK